MLIGSPTSLTCRYSYTGTLLTATFLLGEDPSDLTPIANYVNPFGITYPNETYQEPAYTLTHSTGNGYESIEFRIQTVAMRDDVSFWCVVSLTDASFGRDRQQLNVNGKYTFLHCQYYTIDKNTRTRMFKTMKICTSLPFFLII